MITVNLFNTLVFTVDQLKRVERTRDTVILTFCDSKTYEVVIDRKEIANLLKVFIQNSYGRQEVEQGIKYTTEALLNKLMNFIHDDRTLTTINLRVEVTIESLILPILPS